MRLACLSLMRQLNLSKIKWLDLKMWMLDLFKVKLPSWQTLRLERLACCPPVTSQGDDGHSSGLQDVLRKTIERSLKFWMFPDVNLCKKWNQDWFVIVVI